jgi:ribosomal protein S18 acetylase RimI-like enzyme
MRSETSDGDLLAIQAATRFVMTDSGRVLCENAPDRSAAPRLSLMGCTSGNLARLRHDVGGETAHAIEALVADEPPLGDPDNTPVHLEDYIRLLAGEAPVERWSTGLSWCFPDHLSYTHEVPLVGSGTPEGDRLLARLRDQGMPPALAAIGFVDVGEFWAPWCVALDGDDIASIAFAARLGPHGAETGVATAPAFRGRGFAAAATAGWSSLPALRGRALFYSTSRSNVSSQRVVQRLGLRFLGASLAIT